MIDQQLLLQKASDLGISADTELVKRLDDLRQQMHADSMEEMEKAAQAQGISFEDFKQNLKNNLLTQKVIGQEVGGHITVSNQDIQQYYDQHKTEMDRPEEVRLSEILISTQTTAAVKTEKGETALPEIAIARRRGAGASQGQPGLRLVETGRQLRRLGQKILQWPHRRGGWRPGIFQTRHLVQGVRVEGLRPAGRTIH